MSVKAYVTEVQQRVEQKSFVGGKTLDVLGAPFVKCAVLPQTPMPSVAMSSTHEIVIRLTPEEQSQLTAIFAAINDRVTRSLNETWNG